MIAQGPAVTLMTPFRMQLPEFSPDLSAGAAIEPVIVHATLDQEGHVQESELLQNSGLGAQALALLAGEQFGAVPAQPGAPQRQREIYFEVRFQPAQGHAEDFGPVAVRIASVKKSSCTALLAMLALCARGFAQGRGQPQRLGTEFGISAFERECSKCHGNPAVDRAPSPAAIRAMPPERIYAAITNGTMQTQAANLNDEQKRRLAEYMGGRPLGSAELADAGKMPNQCAPEAMPDPAKGPAWNGWGGDIHNTRFQDAKSAGLTVAQIPNLKLKWAFGFPLGVSAFGQPSVAAGRVFVGSDIGYVYSLDAKTGCVYWSYQAKAAVRTAIVIGHVGNSPRLAVCWRHAGQCVWDRRGFRRTAVDAPRGGSLQRPHHRGSHAVCRTPLCSGVHVRGLFRVHTGVSVLHIPRQCGGAECGDRRSGLEDLHHRGTEADEEELGRHPALCAIRRRGVEFADGRREAQDSLFRHGRFSYRTGSRHL